MIFSSMRTPGSFAFAKQASSCTNPVSKTTTLLHISRQHHVFRHQAKSIQCSFLQSPWTSNSLVSHATLRSTQKWRPLEQVGRLSTQRKNEDGKLSTATLPLPPTASKILTSLRPHENIYTIPNILTFTRLLAAPAVGYFILTAQPAAALALFAYAGITDGVDGYLARRYNQTTVVGTVIDPMADKTLMTLSILALTYTGAIPVWLAVIILGRDAGLAISAIYFRWISLPPPKTMARYWDFSLPSAEVHPTEISKINTLLQLLLVGTAMTLPVLPEALVAAGNLQGVFEGWQYLVAGTTVWSGASYLWAKDAVKILTEAEIEKRMKEAEKKNQAGEGSGKNEV